MNVHTAKLATRVRIQGNNSVNPVAEKAVREALETYFLNNDPDTSNTYVDVHPDHVRHSTFYRAFAGDTLALDLILSVLSSDELSRILKRHINVTTDTHTLNRATARRRLSARAFAELYTPEEPA